MCSSDLPKIAAKNAKRHKKYLLAVKWIAGKRARLRAPCTESRLQPARCPNSRGPKKFHVPPPEGGTPHRALRSGPKCPAKERRLRREDEENSSPTSRGKFSRHLTTAVIWRIRRMRFSAVRRHRNRRGACRNTIGRRAGRSRAKRMRTPRAARERGRARCAGAFSPGPEARTRACVDY